MDMGPSAPSPTLHYITSKNIINIDQIIIKNFGKNLPSENDFWEEKGTFANFRDYIFTLRISELLNRIFGALFPPRFCKRRILDCSNFWLFKCVVFIQLRCYTKTKLIIVFWFWIHFIVAKIQLTISVSHFHVFFSNVSRIWLGNRYYH
jgi:hypothetical protein